MYGTDASITPDPTLLGTSPDLEGDPCCDCLQGVTAQLTVICRQRWHYSHHCENADENRQGY